METQETITAWSRENFGSQSPLTIALRMNVEVAELLNALGSYERAAAEPTSGADDREVLSDARLELREKAADEVADVGVMLLQVAEVLGVDLMERIERKMVKNRARQWARGADGTFQHVAGT